MPVGERSLPLPPVGVRPPLLPRGRPRLLVPQLLLLIQSLDHPPADLLLVPAQMGQARLASVLPLTLKPHLLLVTTYQ